METRLKEVRIHPSKQHTLESNGDNCPVCDIKGIYNTDYILCSIAELKLVIILLPSLNLNMVNYLFAQHLNVANIMYIMVVYAATAAELFFVEHIKIPKRLILCAALKVIRKQHLR